MGWIKTKIANFKKQPSSMDNIYTLNGRVPFFKSIPYGLQHVLAMFVANITPVMIVAGACGIDKTGTATLIQTAMMIAGIATLIQLFPIWKIGAKLPIVMGVSFTFVNVFCVVGAKYGYSSLIGAILIGGLVEGTLGLFAKYWRKIITPLVSACVVTAIGFSLLKIGAESFAGGVGSADFGSWQNWLLGGVSLLACILLNFKQLSILFGLIVGYITAICIGKVDFSALSDISVISLPKILPYKPTFNIGAIFSVLVIFFVSLTETIGDTSALASTALGRNANDREIAGALACDGYASSLSAVFGCLPVTSFSQNVGLAAMTKVVNRYTIATGAFVMVLAGFFPAVGAILATLPDAVLGGCTIMMFGTIVISGIRMLANCGFEERNITVAALAIGVGIGFTQAPQMFAFFPEIVRTVFADNCVATVFVLAIILDLVIPKTKKEKQGKVAVEEVKSDEISE